MPPTPTNRRHTLEARIRRAIGDDAFTQLEAHTFVCDYRAATADAAILPSLQFYARMVPFTKSGAQSRESRRMRVVVSANPRHAFDAGVTYQADEHVLADPIVHYEARDLTAAQLVPVMVALAYDGETTLNPDFPF